MILRICILSQLVFRLLSILGMSMSPVTLTPTTATMISTPSATPLRLVVIVVPPVVLPVGVVAVIERHLILPFDPL